MHGSTVAQNTKPKQVPESIRQMSFRCPAGFAHKLRITAAERQTTTQALIVEAITAFLSPPSAYEQIHKAKKTLAHLTGDQVGR